MPAYGLSALPRRAGFTLAELLVVIGILAALIATLVPLLGKARQMAQRTVCLSNEREVHRSLALYAHENDDRVPIGYRGAKQRNALIYSRPAGQFVLVGKLYPSGLMDDGSIFFCPSEHDPQFTFDTPANPWPPGPASAAKPSPKPAGGFPGVTPVGPPPPKPAASVHAGYGGRPEYELPDDFADPPAALAGFVVPKLTAFRDNAILADLADTLGRVTARHHDGVNVLSGDGSAGWVPLEVFEAPLRASTSPAGWPPDARYDGEQDAIWAAFDRHH